MNVNNNRVLLFLMVSAMLLISLGCSGFSVSFNTVDVGDLHTTTQTLESNDVDEVRVDIKMGAGELIVDGGADDLLEAEFTYNVEDWEPEVSYDVNNGKGRLDIRQPNINEIAFDDDMRYKWDLRFGDTVPIYMGIDIGAGDGEIHLGDVHVTHLDIKASAGKIDVDLRGNHSLSYAEVDIGAGSLTMDLRGDWEEDVDVIIEGGVGETSLHLPDDIGVQVEVTKGIGEVTASGLRKQGDMYVNALYGESDITLYVDVHAGIGRIVLIGD